MTGKHIDVGAVQMEVTEKHIDEATVQMEMAAVQMEMALAQRLWPLRNSYSSCAKDHGSLTLRTLARRRK